MKGCTYIDKKTNEPLAWTCNYHSKIMQFWINKGVDVEIVEESEYQMQSRLVNWLYDTQMEKSSN